MNVDGALLERKPIKTAYIYVRFSVISKTFAGENESI